MLDCNLDYLMAEWYEHGERKTEKWHNGIVVSYNRHHHEWDTFTYREKLWATDSMARFTSRERAIERYGLEHIELLERILIGYVRYTDVMASIGRMSPQFKECTVQAEGILEHWQTDLWYLDATRFALNPKKFVWGLRSSGTELLIDKASAPWAAGFDKSIRMQWFVWDRIKNELVQIDGKTAVTILETHGC